MSITAGEIVSKVQATLEELYPTEFQQLKDSPEKFKTLMEKLEKYASDEITLCQNLAGKVSETSYEDLQKEMAKVYSEERMAMIKDAFSFVTYKIQVIEKDDGKWVTYTRGGKEFYPPRKLTSQRDVGDVSDLQTASIIVEAVILVLNAVGVTVHLSAEEIEAVAKEALEIADDPGVKEALDDLADAMEHQADLLDKAKCIFEVIKKLYDAGGLWKLIKVVCSHMTWYQWLETAALVTAEIIAALATDGAALIAKIALALKSAVDFAAKFANLSKFTEIKSTLPSEEKSYCVTL